MWNHSGTGAYPGDWERSAKLLAENGFNMILPNMLWGGRGPLSQRRAAAERHLPAVRRPDRAVLRRGEEARHRGPRLEGQLQSGDRAEGFCRESSAAKAARKSRSRASRAIGSALRIPRTRSWSWRACWRSPASIRSTVCISTTSAIPTASTATATAAAGGSRPRAAARCRTGLAEGVFLGRAEGRVQRLAMPADHGVGGGGEPRGAARFGPG